MIKALKTIYQLKIGLNGARPPIWRRFLIDSTTSLPRFHKAMQIIMGWSDTHSHQFIVNNVCYGVPLRDYDFMGVLDENKYRLNQILKEEKETLFYEYDFGDSWTHEVTLEKTLPFELNAALPLCIKAKGLCPPEDINGTWGYYNALEALQDNNLSRHKEFKDWIVDHYDTSTYNIETVNALLTKYCR